MLEGQEISEVLLSKISLENRFDSEFYQKIFIKTDKYLRLKKGFEIGSNFKVTDGEHGSVIFRENGIKYLGAENIKNGYVDVNKIKYVDESVNKKNLRAEVEVGDLLISIKGTLGEIAVAEKWLLPANMSRDVAILKPLNSSNISSYLLSVFLMTKYGSIQSQRGGSGGVVQMITLGRLRKFIVPAFSQVLDKTIEELYLLSLSKRVQSKETYVQAENLLLQEIGLEDFEPSKESVNVKSFKESFGYTGRLDAEYYQKKYEIIEESIKAYSNGFEEFSYFIQNYSTGYPYKSESYIHEGGVPLIRINNINKGVLNISNAAKIPPQDVALSPQDVAVENDILISMSGTIGNSCKIPKGVKAVINQRIMRITPKNFNNDVLPLLINSPIGELQLRRIGTGGVQTNISSTDIKKILVPKIMDNIQKQIADLVEESLSLNKQSEHLLEVAKRAVEIAIEKDEKLALQYIENKQNI